MLHTITCIYYLSAWLKNAFQFIELTIFASKTNQGPDRETTTGYVDALLLIKSYNIPNSDFIQTFPQSDPRQRYPLEQVVCAQIRPHDEQLFMLPLLIATTAAVAVLWWIPLINSQAF